MPPHSQRLGALLVILGSAAFGFMPLFNSWVSSADPALPITSLMMVRFSIAAVVLAMIAFAMGAPWPKGRELLVYFILGAVVTVIESFCFFSALRHLPGGMVSLLLYTYPIFITFAAWQFLRERPRGITLIALAIAMTGTVLTVVPMLSQDETISPASSAASSARNVPLGVAFGLATAIFYASYVLTASAIGKTSTRRGTKAALANSVVVMGSCALVFAAITLVRGDPLPAAPMAWAGAGALAVVCSILSMSALLAGMPLISSVKTAALSLVEPLSTILVGWIFLHEHLTPIQLVGGAGILIGAGIVAVQPPTPTGTLEGAAT